MKHIVLSSLCLVLGCAHAWSQDSEKGKEKAKARAVASAKNAAVAVAATEEQQTAPTSQEVAILVEYIVLPHEAATSLMFRFAGQADASPLREEVQKLVDRDHGAIFETFYVRTRSGQRAKVESIHEVMYPTEFDPADMPENLTLDRVDVGKFRGTPTTPTAFSTRSVGSTLEVDPVISQDGTTVDINLVPEIVEHVQDDYFQQPGTPLNENKDVRMPVFYTLKTTTAVSVRSSSYVLIGLHTPRDADGDRIMVFVRADILR